MSLTTREVKISPWLSFKEVEIQGFEEKHNEVDLLEVLLRCGTMLERVTIRLSSKVSQSDRGTKKLVAF